MLAQNHAHSHRPGKDRRKVWRHQYPHIHFALERLRRWGRDCILQAGKCDEKSVGKGLPGTWKTAGLSTRSGSHKVSYAAAVVPGEVRRDFIIIILNNPEFPHFQTNWTLTLSFGVHWNGLISTGQRHYEPTKKKMLVAGGCCT